ncbi:MAG: hypothetical protein KBD37_05700 [Burkholderiales bacterium]|nr:hypothetical protein [Burkholderiales bacterium]
MDNFWKPIAGSQYIFNRLNWINFIEGIAHNFSLRLGIKLDVIIPWGFEVLNNSSYLTKNLKRFYCYFGVSPNNLQQIDKNQLEYDIGMEIINKLKEIDIQFYNRIVGLLVEENPSLFHDSNYKCKIMDCLIVVIVRGSNDILYDYANYIIGTIDGIMRNIGEVANYRSLLVPRWRLFQLYIIHEALFGYLLPNLSQHMQNLKTQIVHYARNDIWPFYNPQAAMVLAEGDELKFIDDLVLPRIFEIQQAIKNGQGEIIKIKAQSFHYEMPLYIEMSKDIYTNAVKKIISTYRRFGLP